MKLNEVSMNVLCAPQGYYLAQAISRDRNFNVGLPAQFDKAFDLKEKLKGLMIDSLEIGECYLTGNLYSLVVKDSSYDAPDRDHLMDAIISMRDNMELEKVKKLAIPKLCCGRMGLEWDDVKSMIEFAFEDSDVEILVCSM